MFPENWLPVNAIEQLSIVPVEYTTMLDPKVSKDPVPLFVISLLRRVMSASTVSLRSKRILPVILSLKTLFSMLAVKELLTDKISNLVPARNRVFL